VPALTLLPERDFILPMRRHALLAVVLLAACRESAPVREFDGASACPYI
jgi:hypothetical protein